LSVASAGRVTLPGPLWGSGFGSEPMDQGTSAYQFPMRSPDGSKLWETHP